MPVTNASILSKQIPSLVKLSQKSILEISGPDSTKFLKGLSCKDVDLLKGGYSGFLNASGRILHTSFIFPTTKVTTTKSGVRREEKSYLITHESPPEHPSPLEGFLQPFKLRAKVRIKDVSDQWDSYSCFSTRDFYDVKGKGKEPIRNWKFGSGGSAESQWSWENNQIRDLEINDNGGEIGCWDLRAGFSELGLGRQILVPKGEKPSLSTYHDISPIEEYHLRRMILGVPEGPDEIIPGSALPLESCMDLHGGVDFRKGCYLGQELTVRTYHTGATRKRILPIYLIPLNQGSDPISKYVSPSPSSSSSSSGKIGLPEDVGGQFEITYHPSSTAASKKPRSAGKILSLHSPSPSNSPLGLGLGLVRIEFIERSCWSPSQPIDNKLTIKEWYENPELHKLITEIGDQKFGVHVDKGEAYSEALRFMSEVEV